MFVYIRSAAFVIVVTQKTSSSAVQKRHAKRAETISPSPSIQYLLGLNLNLCFFRPKRKTRQWPTFLLLHRHT